MERLLSSIFENEALNYAMYTIENRALPDGIDGLKPVQRFVLYSTMQMASKDFAKVAAIGSTVSALGYNHGEVSAQDTLKLMGADWSNNIPLVEGRGNFASRMVQESGAARYVYARLHSNFDKYFKDNSICPEHPDAEHIPPARYVPVVPMVLANGISGIATGFATNILPHCPNWIKKATACAVAGKEIPEPVVKFPAFTGSVVKEGDKYIQKGVVSISGLTATVTEIPTTYNYEKYCALLDKLLNDGKISRWVDETSDTFRFVVKFKRGSNMSEKSVLKALKLTAAFTPNVNVIWTDRKLRHYDDVRDLVRDFVDYRLGFLSGRIKHGIDQAKHKVGLTQAKFMFISNVIEDKIVVRGKTRKQLKDELAGIDTYKGHVTELLNLTMDKMTSDEVEKLRKEYETALSELEYWNSTTEQKEFVKDLRAL